MTSITIYTLNGRIQGFQASGHAGAKKIRGYDLICCAVSALTQTGVNALETVAGVLPLVQVEDGFLRCILPEGLHETEMAHAQIVLETVITGLKNIEEIYPKLVRIRKEEWRQADA